MKTFFVILNNRHQLITDQVFQDEKEAALWIELIAFSDEHCFVYPVVFKKPGSQPEFKLLDQRLLFDHPVKVDRN